MLRKLQSTKDLTLMQAQLIANSCVHIQPFPSSQYQRNYASISRIVIMKDFKSCPKCAENIISKDNYDIVASCKRTSPSTHGGSQKGSGGESRAKDQRFSTA